MFTYCESLKYTISQNYVHTRPYSLISSINLSLEASEAKSDNDETRKNSMTEANTSNNTTIKAADETGKEETSISNTTTAESSDTTALIETSESTQSADDKS